LFCEHFNNAIGVKTTLIPYRGGSAAIPDIVSGRIDYLCTFKASATAPIEARSVKPVASFTLGQHDGASPQTRHALCR
jgi:tripartite-type tricarboxylate transporter receptor subunit TctC